MSDPRAQGNRLNIRLGRGELVRLSGIEAVFQTDGGSILALRDVDLSVSEGELVVVLGPSGCGKTTLLKIVAGLLEPSAGIRTLRDDLVSERGRKMGLISQRPALLPWMTIEQNAMLPYKLGDVRPDTSIDDRLDRLLKLVRLSGFRRAMPHELSGGMQMRASLVRGLLPNPALILFDEPLAAVDEATRLRLALEVRALLHAQNCSSIWVTHSLQEAALIADRVVVLSSRPGRVRTQVVPSYGVGERTEAFIESDEFRRIGAELREGLGNG